jgi:hypothetical protein
VEVDPEDMLRTAQEAPQARCIARAGFSDQNSNLARGLVRGLRRG